jgi:GNAT superfamily N-acetyltransferase
MQLRITKAKPAHLQALVSIFTAANRYKLERDDRSWAPGFTEKGVTWMLSLGTMYVACLGDPIVGTLALDWADDDWDDERDKGERRAGYIRRLAVREDFHGQQIGAQIIDWAAGQAAREGRDRLRLDCNIANTKLCTYYEKQGFQRVVTKEFPAYHYTAALYERPMNNQKFDSRCLHQV